MWVFTRTRASSNRSGRYSFMPMDSDQIHALGTEAVVAESYARIFFRNCIAT